MSRTKRNIPHWAARGSDYYERIANDDFGPHIPRKGVFKTFERNRFVKGLDNKWSAHKNRDDREAKAILDKHLRNMVDAEIRQAVRVDGE